MAEAGRITNAEATSGLRILQSVTALPAYVYFHHGVHVQNGVACAACHGRVDDMPRVAPAHRMTMDFCLDCHREHAGRAISRLTTCTACHR